jgi:hypothetical protein
MVWYVRRVSNHGCRIVHLFGKTHENISNLIDSIFSIRIADSHSTTHWKQELGFVVSVADFHIPGSNCILLNLGKDGFHWISDFE